MSERGKFGFFMRLTEMTKVTVICRNPIGSSVLSMVSHHGNDHRIDSMLPPGNCEAGSRLLLNSDHGLSERSIGEQAPRSLFT